MNDSAYNLTINDTKNKRNEPNDKVYGQDQSSLLVGRIQGKTLDKGKGYHFPIPSSASDNAKVLHDKIELLLKDYQDNNPGICLDVFIHTKADWDDDKACVVMKPYRVSTIVSSADRFNWYQLSGKLRIQS